MNDNLQLQECIYNLLVHLNVISSRRTPLEKVPTTAVKDIDRHLDWLLDNDYYDLNEQFRQVFSNAFDNNYHLTAIIPN